MYQPYIDILVDGVMQRREAYIQCIEADDIVTPTYRLRPVVHDNEVLRETLDGYMEIVTVKKP